MKLLRSASGPAVRAVTGLQVESWRLIWQELAADEAALAECREWEARGLRRRPEILELLGRYLAGQVSTEELRAAFDDRTRTDWDVFGLKGMSGAMYLSKLVKHVPDAAALAAQLRAVLPSPPDVETGRHRLRAFVEFLHGLIRRGHAQTRHLQPARAPLFVSLWWHLQDPDRWPGFHLAARKVMQAEADLYAPSGDSVGDYFAFRDAYTALAAALGVTSSQLEFLCRWHHRRNLPAEADSYYDPGTLRRRSTYRRRARACGVVREASVPPPDDERAIIEHTHVQWLLATLGRKLGCRVWIAANDQSRRWGSEPLGALSIQRFPTLGLDPDSQRIISLIDVVWLKGVNQVVAAFEVEQTSSVYSGLLRMADLAALSPNLSFPLYIVTPADRLEKVRRELSRPTFRSLELHRRCGFFSDEALLDAADSIMRWADGPAAIEKLAERAGEASSPGRGDW